MLCKLCVFIFINFPEKLLVWVSLVSETLQNCMNKYTKCLIIIINFCMWIPYRIALFVKSKLPRAKASFFVGTWNVLYFILLYGNLRQINYENPIIFMLWYEAEKIWANILYAQNRNFSNSKLFLHDWDLFTSGVSGGIKFFKRYLEVSTCYSYGRNAKLFRSFKWQHFKHHLRKQNRF